MGKQCSRRNHSFYGFSTPPNTKEIIGFWALAGRRGLSGRAAGSRKPPTPRHPTPCSAARDSRPMPGNPGNAMCGFDAICLAGIKNQETRTNDQAKGKESTKRDQVSRIKQEKKDEQQTGINKTRIQRQESMQRKYQETRRRGGEKKRAARNKKGMKRNGKDEQGEESWKRRKWEKERRTGAGTQTPTRPAPAVRVSRGA